MGVQVQSKETVAAMFNKGEAAIIQKYEPTGSETVGFGKYGTMTFEEVAENHQDIPGLSDMVHQGSERG